LLDRLNFSSGHTVMHYSDSELQACEQGLLRNFLQS
jgi:hypothetical protein